MSFPFVFIPPWLCFTESALFRKYLYNVCYVAMKIDAKNVQYRLILLYYFKKDKRAADAQRQICGSYGNDALTESVYQKWFTKNRTGDFIVNDVQHAFRQTVID